MGRAVAIPHVACLNVCPGGCYKHYVKGMGWVCCKCGN
jgi:hypothetical protein